MIQTGFNYDPDRKRHLAGDVVIVALKHLSRERQKKNLNMTKFFLSLAILPLSLLLTLDPASGQSGGSPKFNPKTKSYFEVRFDNNKGVWQEAKRLAESKVYKGVRGRLAVVSNPDVHGFLRKNFKIQVETWIGLRYWCTFRKVQWVTGEVLIKGAFAVWANPWDRRDIPFCEGAQSRADGYMPVYYQPTNLGFRWQAVNSGKHFKQYFVEYPTKSE